MYNCISCPKDVRIWRMFAYMSVVVIVWESVEMLFVAGIVKDAVLHYCGIAYYTYI